MSKEESPDELLEEINQARDNIKKLSVIAKDIDPDNLCLHLTYLSTQKLRKHSKTLNFWNKSNRWYGNSDDTCGYRPSLGDD